jgi:hypothetical protein
MCSQQYVERICHASLKKEDKENGSREATLPKEFRRVPPCYFEPNASETACLGQRALLKVVIRES